MSRKRKNENKKSPYQPDVKVRIRKSYYTFSREYPSKYIQLGKKKRRSLRKRIGAFLLSAALFAAAVVFSFFLVNTGLEISFASPDSLTTSQPDQSSDESAPAALQAVRALYMPCEKLGDTEYIKTLIEQIKHRNGNSVIIDFKTEDGKLAYSSLEEYAIKGKCSLFDNNTVRLALDLFENSGISVIAGIHCFRDNTAAAANSELAVKYMDTDVNWLDSSQENEASAWLNPISKDARLYIKGIIKELLSFKIKGFLLYSFSFPEGELVSSATYPGESASTDRKKLMTDFLSSLSQLIPEDSVLLLAQDSKKLLEGESEDFSLPCKNLSVTGIVADMQTLSGEYTVTKEDNFTSMLSCLSALSARTGDKLFIHQTSSEDYSRSYFRTLRKNGFDNFIIYSREGEY